MDIGKYVGLFLIKNEYCYLPGVGSLQVERRTASYDSETKQVSPPEYEVIFKKSAGSIDDSFANFVANNERISIAHAANAFRDYCAALKDDVREGKEVAIPGIGKFVGDASGELDFVADPSLEIKGKSVPFFKISPVAEKRQGEALTNIIDNTEIREPKADEEIIMKAPQVNWGKIVLMIVLILGVLATVGYFALFKGEGRADHELEEQQDEIYEEETAPAPVVDEPEEDAPAVVTSAEDDGNYRLVINAYPSVERAERRVIQLNSYGHNVTLYTADSVDYKVVMVVEQSVDSNKLIDSLDRLFGTKVHVLK